MTASSSIMRLLGVAGLVPFVIPVLLVYGGSQHAETAYAAAGMYAFGIISFLCGSWWGLALRNDAPKALWLSNIFFLIAFFIFMFASAWWPLAAAILLMSLLFTEQGGLLFEPFPKSYREMRVWLSAIAGGSMLALQLSAVAG